MKETVEEEGEPIAKSQMEVLELKGTGTKGKGTRQWMTEDRDGQKKEFLGLKTDQWSLQPRRRKCREENAGGVEEGVHGTECAAGDRGQKEREKCGPMSPTYHQIVTYVPGKLDGDKCGLKPTRGCTNAESQRQGENPESSEGKMHPLRGTDGDFSAGPAQARRPWAACAKRL